METAVPVFENVVNVSSSIVNIELATMYSGYIDAKERKICEALETC